MMEEYERYARYDGEAINLIDKNLKSFVKLGSTIKATSRGRPKINRGKLRKILLESLPKDTIR